MSPVEKKTRKRMVTEQLTRPHKMHNMGPDGGNVDMSDERMGVPFPWADVRFLFLSVFSFFDLVCSQSYSCVTCSGLRQHCFLAVDVEGPVRWNNVENGYDSVKTGQTGEVAETTRGSR